MKRIVEDLMEGVHAGSRGFVVTGNIWDLLCLPGQAPARVPMALGSALQRRGYGSVVVSRSLGCQVLTPPENEDRSGIAKWVQGVAKLTTARDRFADALELLNAVDALLRQKDKPVAVFLDFAQHLAPATPDGLGAASAPEQQIALERIHRWGHDEELRVGRNMLVLLAPEGSIHELLTDGGGYRVLKAGLPETEDRGRFLSLMGQLAERGRSEFSKLSNDLGIEQAAALSAGLRLTDLEQLLRSAGSRGEVATAELIRREKARIIAERCGDLLEVLEPTCRLGEVSGLAHVTEFLTELASRLKAGRRDVPRAILFMGVPGCGKTFVVSALAAELGWNCLVMRSILSRWVGESERNLEKAFSMAEGMKPCVFFIDEVDQALVKRGEGGDAGTSQRMLKRTMEFLAEERHRGQILFVAATNAPHMLDPAIDDRFGVKIPFLHPSEKERAHLLPVLTSQLGRRLSDTVDAGRIAAMPALEGSTVRGLLEVVAMASHCVDVDVAPGAPIDELHLTAAARTYRPACNPLQHDFIALMALRKTSFTSLYPWMKRVGGDVERREGVEIPPYLREIVAPGDGSVNEEALEARIRELGQRLQSEAAMGRL